MSQAYKILNRDISIVLIGGFNTLKYTPDWLFKLNLINKADFDNAKLEIISTHECLTILDWCSIHVGAASQKDFRFSLTLTDHGSYQLFLDLLHSIFELEDVTVMTALGINFSYKIKHSLTDEWNEWGYRLAPPQNWREAFCKEDQDNHIGMRGLSMSIDSLLEPIEEVEGKKTSLHLQVVPELQSKDEKNGNNYTRIALNYHFPLNPENGSVMAIETIQKYLNDLENEVDDRVHKLVVGVDDE